MFFFYSGMCAFSPQQATRKIKLFPRIVHFFASAMRICSPQQAASKINLFGRKVHFLAANFSDFIQFKISQKLDLATSNKQATRKINFCFVECAFFCRNKQQANSIFVSRMCIFSHPQCALLRRNKQQAKSVLYTGMCTF